MTNVRSCGVLFAGLLVICAARPAAADKATAAARAFTEGQAAAVDGDHERAAERFELAHSILPSKEALRSAVRERLASSQLARAAMLAEQLLSAYSADPPSSKLAHDVLGEAKARLARVHVTCEGGCTIVVDGRAVSTASAPRHVFFVAPGRQTVGVGFGNDVVIDREIVGKVGDEISLAVPRPPLQAAPAAAAAARPAPTAAAPRKRLPRLVPLIGIAATVATAGVATWSSLDTRSAYDDYAADPTEDKFTAGRSKQLRTNILWGTTAVFGLATAATAVWTDWRGKRGKRAESQLTVLPSSTDVVVMFTRPL